MKQDLNVSAVWVPRRIGLSHPTSRVSRAAGVCVTLATVGCDETTRTVYTDGSDALTVQVHYSVSPSRAGGPASWYEFALLVERPKTVDVALDGTRGHAFVEAHGESFEILDVAPGRATVVVRGVTAPCGMPWYGEADVDLAPGDGPWTVNVNLQVLIAGHCQGACMSEWCLEQTTLPGRCGVREDDPPCP